MFDVVVGVGNRYRRDDGAGPAVAERVVASGRPALVHAGDGTGLMELFGRHPALILVDATQSGAAAGTIVRLDALAAPLRSKTFRHSTHRFGLAEAVETARALGALPERLLVIGIEGLDFGFGEGLTPVVADAVDRVLMELAGNSVPA